MEEQDLINLWRTNDKKLEKTLSLNYKCLEEIQKLKVKSVLGQTKAIKIFSVLVGILWVLFLGFFVANSLTFPRIFFVVSASINIIVSVIAIYIYIKHLVLIYQIDNSETVVEAQQKLATLQTTNMQIVRLLLLQLPVFSTFHINSSMVENGNIALWIFQISISLLFTIIGVWFYRNINRENMHKKWFKVLFSGKEWSSVTKAMEFLNEIEEYKKELST